MPGNVLLFHVLRQSTIGAERLDCRVRYGIGYYTFAIITRHSFLLKKIRLVKIDIEKNPNIAGQLRVQSIPAVFAFSNGQSVDGFMGAQTPSQAKEFIKKIVVGFASNGCF